MIGDRIELKEKHLATAREITAIVKQRFSLGKEQKIAIGIAGESGSGKSVTAFAVQKVLEQENLKCIVLQMDDYFKLPPKTNHGNRLKSLDNVGIHEVDLDQLSQNIRDFKNEIPEIEKPLVNYGENTVSNERVNTSGYNIMIAEGTYVLEIEPFDFTIFIDRDYKDTYRNRMDRNRDEQSDFIERVLEIEHQIIRNFKDSADLILGKNYELLNTGL